jgi:hypothetical protein
VQYSKLAIIIVYLVCAMMYIEHDLEFDCKVFVKIEHDLEFDCNDVYSCLFHCITPKISRDSNAVILSAQLNHFPLELA